VFIIIFRIVYSHILDTRAHTIIPLTIIVDIILSEPYLRNKI